ncbi:hypothetical protein D3C76_239220 [compost metagenome]
MNTNIAENVLERAREFIYSSARLIDRMRFSYLFENGSKNNVLDALRAYQNRDGGFGNALEPDMRCPDSQPVSTEMGLSILGEVNAYDSDVFNGVIKYLESITLEGGGLPRATTHVNAYPHAPWWTTENDDVPSINPTGSIVGMLLAQKTRTDFVEEPWFRSHISFLWNRLQAKAPEDFHDAMQWISFLEQVDKVDVENIARAEQYRALLDSWLSGPQGIEKDEAAEGYVHKVLDYAPAPDSYASRLVNEEEVSRHLDWLISGQQGDGGWAITFPAISLASEQEWRGWMTVDRLKILKAYGVLK